MIFKPVADLYLIKYGDGRIYKCTSDAEEAVDAIGFGFEVEEFVSLDNHRAAMLQGAENAESTTTTQTAPALDSSPKIDESPSGNSLVIPDGWVACSERMPNIGVPVITCCGDVVQYAAYAWDGKEWQDWYEEYDKLPANTFTHWHPRPAAPQQEVNKPELADKFKILDFGRIDILKSDNAPTMRVFLSDFRIISDEGFNNNKMLLSILDYVKRHINHPRSITYVDGAGNIVLKPRDTPARTHQEEDR